MCVSFPWCLLWSWKNLASFGAQTHPTPWVCLSMHRSDLVYGLESCRSHITRAEQLCQKGQEKFISALLLLASILRNYLLSTVPQVIVKLTHLEANKFSDINKLSKKWCYFWNFLICRYVSDHTGMQISLKVVYTLQNHTKQLSN